jgi:Excisionase-like protein
VSVVSHTILPEVLGEKYATRALAAAVLREAGQPVTAATVRDWQRVGLLRPAALVKGRVWYRMADVWKAERDTRRHPRRPRGA